jgi:hypothetical protein
VTFEQLIVQYRSYLDKTVRKMALQQYLSAPEQRELHSRVMTAIERNDFELLRAFEGRTTWEKHFDLVVMREFFLYQGQLWGQWRPSSGAKRLGRAGVLLEELVSRVGLSVAQAIETMRTRHRVDMPRYRLAEMAKELRLNAPPKPPLDPSKREIDGERRAALNRALTRLSPDDRLIVELRFRDQQPLTRIAKLLNIGARSLQHRLEQINNVIAESLLEAGIAPEDVTALLEDAERESSPVHQDWWHTVLSRPSK